MTVTSILLISSVLVGVWLGRQFGKNQFLGKRLLILSAGFLIAICVLEVLPMVYGRADGQIGIFVLVGVLLQMLLESLTKGFEHGHFHHHSEKNILPLGLVVGMFLHAFLEGVPLRTASEGWSSPYVLGIALHNLPISYVIGQYLFGKSSRVQPMAVLTIVLFAIATPLGIFFGGYIPVHWHPYLLALVAGIFLHISAVIIFESNQQHKMDWGKLLLVVAGMALAWSGHLFHEH